MKNISNIEITRQKKESLKVCNLFYYKEILLWYLIKKYYILLRKKHYTICMYNIILKRILKR